MGTNETPSPSMREEVLVSVKRFAIFLLSLDIARGLKLCCCRKAMIVVKPRVMYKSVE